MMMLMFTQVWGQIWCDCWINPTTGLRSSSDQWRSPLRGSERGCWVPESLSEYWWCTEWGNLSQMLGDGEQWSAGFFLNLGMSSLYTFLPTFSLLMALSLLSHKLCVTLPCTATGIELSCAELWLARCHVAMYSLTSVLSCARVLLDVTFWAV